MNRNEEVAAIEAYVSSGKVYRCHPGESYFGDDALPFKFGNTAVFARKKPPRYCAYCRTRRLTDSRAKYCSRECADLGKRKTHCQNGHPFDEKNTRIRKNGQRSCRACANEREKRRRRK